MAGGSPHWEGGPGSLRPGLATQGGGRPETAGKQGLPSPSPEQQEREHSRTGGGEEREMAERIGKAAGGVKICRWRDVQMTGRKERPGSQGMREAGVASRTTMESVV